MISSNPSQIGGGRGKGDAFANVGAQEAGEREDDMNYDLKAAESRVTLSLHPSASWPQTPSVAVVLFM